MKGYAGLSIFGDTLDFAALTRVMGFKPDALSRKGDLLPMGRSVSTDIWRYASREKRRSAAPDKPLDYLMRKLFAKRDAVELLKDHVQFGVQRMTVGMLLELKGSHGTFRVALRHIQLAAALGASLWFDVWRTKPRSLQNYTAFDWDGVQRGSNIVLCVETDFIKSDVYFAPFSARIQPCIYCMMDDSRLGVASFNGAVDEALPPRTLNTFIAGQPFLLQRVSHRPIFEQRHHGMTDC